MPHNFSFVIPGKLAGMARPGSMGDLESELLYLRRQGIGAVVSLTEYPLDLRVVEKLGMGYLHLPIADFTPPSLEQIKSFVEFVSQKNKLDLAVAAHCAAGMGRTGTMLACYLVALGLGADEAIDSIRSIRPGSIETVEQEMVVQRYEQYCAELKND